MDLPDLRGQTRVLERAVRRRSTPRVVNPVRLTPNTRHITTTGKFVLSAAMNEYSSSTARACNRNPDVKRWLMLALLAGGDAPFQREALVPAVRRSRCLGDNAVASSDAVLAESRADAAAFKS
jgi:hypothetical protein